MKQRYSKTMFLFLSLSSSSSLQHCKAFGGLVQNHYVKKSIGTFSKPFMTTTTTTTTSQRYGYSRFSTTTCLFATTPSSTSSTTSTTTSTNPGSNISANDEKYLLQAIQYAQLGYGKTFPNPAVGCVLVRQHYNDNEKTDDQNHDHDDDVVIGSGFHPKAGYPHAEIFALLEASGHVKNGVEAAKQVINHDDDNDNDDGNNKDSNQNDYQHIQNLFNTYVSNENGPNELFGNAFASSDDDDDDDIEQQQKRQLVTAYVTLEPCCHYGKTPPCATTFVLSKVDRVVIGFRDPNPKVNGGGVQILVNAGIVVDIVPENTALHDKCSTLVTNFVKRIIPKDYDVDYSWMNGAHRSALRRLAGIQKSDDTLPQISWSGKTVSLSNIPSKTLEDEQDDEQDDTDTDTDLINQLTLDANWMEHIDETLWEHELVNLRLSSAVKKKKLARQLGQRIAVQLHAHVTQAVGHTVLLYRPGLPPKINVHELISSSS